MLRFLTAGLKRLPLSYANITASVALFIALGGASYAAVVLPAGSVGTKQLASGSVTPIKLSRGLASTGGTQADAIAVSGCIPAVAGGPQPSCPAPMRPPPLITRTLALPARANVVIHGEIQTEAETGAGPADVIIGATLDGEPLAAVTDQRIDTTADNSVDYQAYIPAVPRGTHVIALTAQGRTALTFGTFGPSIAAPSVSLIATATP